MQATLQRTQAILPMLLTKQRTAARILQRTATTLLTSQTATKYHPGLWPHYINTESGGGPMNYQVISEKTLSRYLEMPGLLLVDLRSREDYSKIISPVPSGRTGNTLLMSFPVFLPVSRQITVHSLRILSCTVIPDTSA